MVNYLGKQRGLPALKSLLLIMSGQNLMVQLRLSPALLLADVFLKRPVDKLILDIPPSQHLTNQKAFLEGFQQTQKRQAVCIGQKQFQILHLDFPGKNRHSPQRLSLLSGQAGKPGLNHIVCLL